MYKRGDSIALTKGLLIAARRLSGDELALSVCFADTSPKGRGSGVSVRLSFVQPLRRFAPAPLVGEPLAKRRGFTVCQGLSYKERWHCAAMTERLDKGEATHERKTQKNRHLTVTVRLSVQFIMTHSQTHPLRPFAKRRWRWCRGPRGRRPSRRRGCPPPLSPSCP